MLLHDPEEAPLVEDLGFAIAPGTHVLVAVRREQVFKQTINRHEKSATIDMFNKTILLQNVNKCDMFLGFITRKALWHLYTWSYTKILVHY